MRNWKEGDPIVCRFCGGTRCEHGDDCRDCGCPECGMPGARLQGRGFCHDCGWEAVPGAHRAWRDRQPNLTLHQMHRLLMGLLGADLPPDDEVQPAIWPKEGEE